MTSQGDFPDFGFDPAEYTVVQGPVSGVRYDPDLIDQNNQSFVYKNSGEISTALISWYDDLFDWFGTPEENLDSTKPETAPIPEKKETDILPILLIGLIGFGIWKIGRN